MKKTAYTRAAAEQMINEVEQGHRAFLLHPNKIENVIDKYNMNFGFLPKRLQNGTITISSAENLPNAYKSYTVNNTIVVLAIKNGNFKIKSVERKSVYKNSFPTEIVFSDNCIEEIKNKLYCKFTD